MIKHNKEIGEICKQARKAYGISVAKFATAYCECSKESVYKFEQGETDSASLLLQYLRFFSDEEYKKIRKLAKGGERE